MTCIIDKNVIDCEFRVSVIIILQGFYASDSDLLNETVLQVQKKYHVIASCCYTCHINMMWSINVFLFTYKISPGYQHIACQKLKIRLLLRTTYLSRHCLPIRPGKYLAIADHFLLPYLWTSSTIRSSSCRHKHLYILHTCSVFQQNRSTINNKNIK